MEHGKDHKIRLTNGLPPDLGDADLSTEKGFGRPSAERADHLGLDQLDLLEQERLAGFDFVRFRITVVRRTALDHVGDVDLGTSQPCGLQQFVQQLACRAHEWFPLLVLVKARGLTHEHDRRVRVSDPKDHLRPSQLG